MRENRGRHFDPELVDAFFAHLLDIRNQYADYNNDMEIRPALAAPGGY